MKPIIKLVVEGFSIPPDQAIYIFNLFIYGLLKECIEKGGIRVRGLGFFYLGNINFPERRNICGKVREIKNTTRLIFLPQPRFKREIDGKVDEISLCKRSCKIVNLLKIDRRVVNCK